MPTCQRCFEDKEAGHFVVYASQRHRPWCNACVALPVPRDYTECKALAREAGRRARELGLDSGLSKADADRLYRKAYVGLIVRHPDYKARNVAGGKRRRDRNPIYALAGDQATRSKNPALYTVLYALSSAKRSAKKKGVPFSLTSSDVWPIPDTCPILGTPIVLGVGRAASRSDASPALDRIVPSLGYVPGNVHWICDLANRIKTNATWEQIERVGAYLKRLRVGL